MNSNFKTVILQCRIAWLDFDCDNYYGEIEKPRDGLQIVNYLQTTLDFIVPFF